MKYKYYKAIDLKVENIGKSIEPETEIDSDNEEVVIIEEGQTVIVLTILLVLNLQNTPTRKLLIVGKYYYRLFLDKF